MVKSTPQKQFKVLVQRLHRSSELASCGQFGRERMLWPDLLDAHSVRICTGSWYAYPAAWTLSCLSASLASLQQWWTVIFLIVNAITTM